MLVQPHSTRRHLQRADPIYTESGTTRLMEPKVEVIGVYAVPEEMWTHNQPVYLIELQFRGATPFDAGALVQELPGKPEDSWQVAYDERELDVSGEREIDQR